MSEPFSRDPADPGSDSDEAKLPPASEAELFRLLVHSVTDYAILVLDPSGHVVTWNEGARRIKGYEPHEIIGHHFSQFYPPGDVERGKPDYELGVAAAEGKWQGEGYRIRKDGSLFWATVVITALKDADGRVIAFAKLTRDLTARKQAEDERDHLLTVERETRREAEQVTRELRATQRVADVALGDLDLDTLLQGVLDAVSDLFVGDMAAVLLVDPSDPTWLTVRATRGADAALGTGVRVGQGFAGKIAAGRRPLTTADYQPGPGIDPVAQRIGVRSLLGAPLVVNDVVNGVLEVGNYYARYFTESEANLLRILADRASLGIDRARLFAAATTAQQSAEAAEQSVRRTNEELESFSYSVSHDLQAPLRSIDGFSLALAEDHGNELSEGAREDVQRIRAAAQRMILLIDDLLRLSRISQSSLVLSHVDLGETAAGIVARLRQADPGRDVITEMDKELIVRGDADLLQVALDNLIGNAWKFTRKRGRAHIELRAGRVDGETVYTVRDNGEGFDMAYASHLFAPFQRLHSASEFEGTGIGLATVRRVIARHGGRVWAEAASGAGASFHFTLNDQAGAAEVRERGEEPRVTPEEQPG